MNDKNNFKKGGYAMRRTIISFATISLVFISTAAIALAGGQLCTDSWDLLAKAAPDECFYDVGSDLNQYPLIDSCEPPGQLKRNEAYVWGLTKYGDNMFYGTGPNIHCLVIGGYTGRGSVAIRVTPVPTGTKTQ